MPGAASGLCGAGGRRPGLGARSVPCPGTSGAPGAVSSAALTQSEQQHLASATGSVGEGRQPAGQLVLLAVLSRPGLFPFLGVLSLSPLSCFPRDLSLLQPRLLTVLAAAASPGSKPAAAASGDPGWDTGSPGLAHGHRPKAREL